MSGDGKTLAEGRSPSEYVKLNVGGSLHFTTIATLTKYDTMLKAMFSGRSEVVRDPEGWVLIDRCGKHFGAILNFLRDGSVPLPESVVEMKELLAEVNFYCLPQLASELELVIAGKEDGSAMLSAHALCVTSEKAESLIKSPSRRVVRLQILMNFNTFFYSTQAGSLFYLSKNLQLFEKLSRRYSDKVLSIKVTEGHPNFCLWTFHAFGKEVGRVQCVTMGPLYEENSRRTIKYPKTLLYATMTDLFLNEYGEALPPLSISDDESEFNSFVHSLKALC